MKYERDEERIDDAERAAFRAKAATVKSLLFFWLQLFIVHMLFSVVFYNVILARILTPMYEGDDMVPLFWFFCIYGLIVLLGFCIYYSVTMTGEVSYSEALKAAMKESGFSVLGYFAQAFLRINLYRVGIFAVYQLPFMIFFAVYGFWPKYTTPLEAQYRLEAGTYALIGNWLLGFLVMTAIFAVFLFGMQYLVLVLRHRAILRDAPEGFYTDQRAGRELSSVVIWSAIALLYLLLLAVGFATAAIRESVYMLLIISLGVVLGCIILVKLYRFAMLYRSRARLCRALRHAATENKWEYKAHHAPMRSFFHAYRGADISLYDRKNEIHVKFLPFQPSRKKLHMEGDGKITYSTVFTFFLRGRIGLSRAGYVAEKMEYFVTPRKVDLSFDGEKGVFVYVIPAECLQLSCLAGGGSRIDIVDNGYVYENGAVFYDAKALPHFLKDLMEKGAPISR